MTDRSADWRPLITTTLARVWPALPDGAHWIEAQVSQESQGDPTATSPVGAGGLLQLMPDTGRELGVTDRFDPIQNLDGGIRYLRTQYEHLAEIPNHPDRLRWAFASYNGGRGFVNKATAAARADGISHWWEWATGRWWLMHRDCQVAGVHPDYRQMWGYVDTIAAKYAALIATAGHTA